MRAAALLLPLLAVILACKPDSGEDTGGSSTGSCPNDIGDALDVDPKFPTCDCDFKCEDDAKCRSTEMSSICEPKCTNGPSCDADVPCADSDCPPLAGFASVCDGGHCALYCDEKNPCPNGYVCIENIACQVAQ